MITIIKLQMSILLDRTSKKENTIYTFVGIYGGYTSPISLTKIINTARALVFREITCVVSVDVKTTTFTV